MQGLPSGLPSPASSSPTLLPTRFAVDEVERLMKKWVKFSGEWSPGVILLVLPWRQHVEASWTGDFLAPSMARFLPSLCPGCRRGDLPGDCAAAAALSAHHNHDRLMYRAHSAPGMGFGDVDRSGAQASSPVLGAYSPSAGQPGYALQLPAPHCRVVASQFEVVHGSAPNKRKHHTLQE